jgi:HEPN domain-containing protein
MKPITSEWIAKAEADLVTAERELLAERDPNYDAAAFHAQQCAEKYLKACLVEAAVDFPKTHDLAAILDLVLRIEPEWESLRGELNALTDLAVEVRYPGVSADVEDAGRAVTTARKIRDAVCASLGLHT